MYQPVTAVMPHDQPRKSTRAAVAAYIVGTVGLALAAVTLAVFLLWKGSVESRISELRGEVVSAQQTQAGTTSSITNLRDRVNGLSDSLASMNFFVSGYAAQCQVLQDTSGVPASYLVPCKRQK